VYFEVATKGEGRTSALPQCDPAGGGKRGNKGGKEGRLTRGNKGVMSANEGKRL